MFNPPDEVRQRCVALAKDIDRGTYLHAYLNKQIWFWRLRESKEAAETAEQQTRTWCNRVRRSLTDEERVAVDRIHETTRNPTWDEAWDIVIGRIAAPENPEYAYNHVFDVVSNILNHLKAIRLRLTPPMPIPDHLSQRITDGFRRLGEGTIDDLFLNQGCISDWWVFPVYPTGTQSADRVLGWLDGIHLYKPDEVIGIVQRVYRALHTYKRKPLDPDDSVLTELAVLAQPVPSRVLQRYALHPQVEQIAAQYWPIGAYDTALMMVCTALDNAVQAKSGQSGYGATLMKTVFSAKTPILKVDPRFGEQIGFMDLFAGAMGALRNARAHNAHLHQSNLTEDEAVEWLAFLSALFRVLDSSTL